MNNYCKWIIIIFFISLFFILRIIYKLTSVQILQPPPSRTSRATPSRGGYEMVTQANVPLLGAEAFRMKSESGWRGNDPPALRFRNYGGQRRGRKGMQRKSTKTFISKKKQQIWRG